MNWSYTIKEKDHPHYGETLWSGRYTTVLAIVVYLDKQNKLWFLANKRGKGTPDYQGKWNMVCGFMEDDESGEECCAREVYEETGIKLDPKMFILDSVETDPKISNKGHVTLNYFYITYEKTSKFNIDKLEGGEENEVDDIRWICEDDVDKYDWAFNQKSTIDKIINEYKRNYGNSI